MKRQTRFLKATFGLLILLIASAMLAGYASPTPSQHKLSSSWSARNIGAVGRKGVLVSSGDVLKVSGSGRDIGGTRDQFYYVYTPLSGNGQLIAHVTSQAAANGAAKSGLMLRETLVDNAANVFLSLTPHAGIAIQWRGTTGGATRQIFSPQRKVPLWMKLVRQNNTVTAWTSYNGLQWIKVQSVTTSMSATAYMGLAVTSHDETRLSQAVFMHVFFSKIPNLSPIPTSVPPTPTPTAIPSPTPIPAMPVSLSATRVYGQGDDFTANGVDVNATSLNTPNEVVLDSSGNLYASDTNNNRVLYYPAGSTKATRVYGQGGNFSTNATNVSATSLSGPFGLAIDSSGNLYVADAGNSRVLYYPAGSMTATRVYGQGGNLSGTSDNNGGVSADSLSTPNGVAVDSSGNLYIVDALNNRVLYYPAGSTTATRVYGQTDNFSTNTAGAGTTGLNNPNGVAIDSSGNLYIADSGNNRVLYYPTGSTTATRVYGQRGSFTVKVANNSGVSAASLNTPNGVTLDSSGNLYIADSRNNRVLYYSTGSTTATRVYGQGDSLSTNAANVGATGLKTPDAVAVDGSGNVYVADTGNNRVLYYPEGSTTATQVYGQAGSFLTNAGNVSATSLNGPSTLAIDASNNVYITDAGNSRVLYYPAGTTTATRVYGQGGSFSINVVNNNVSADSLNIPNAVAVDKSGNLYIADSGNNRVLYYAEGSTTATRVYGQGGNFSTNAGNVGATGLNTPYGVILDKSGNLYIADSGNNRVLYYPAGTTTATRVYGQGGSFSTNAGNVGATGLSIPVGIALDSSGNLYIVDSNNNRVLYYPAGSTTATRVYGQGGSFSTNTPNKYGVSAASFYSPLGIAIDSRDNFYITDPGNSRILYYPAGSTTATRVYGQGGSFSTNVVNNGGVSATSLMYPAGITLDSSGNLYVADNGDNRALMFPHT